MGGRQSDPDAIELLVLEFLHRSDGPLGCGAVADYLRQQGYGVSEATAGRLLRELDARGYTARVGYRGRALTETGLARLSDLRQSQAISACSVDLLEALKPNGLEEVVDILVARRCLEREIARLSAERATDGDLAEIAVVLERYEQASSPQEAAEADLEFHSRLAAVAGNRVLKAALRLVHREVETTPLPAAVFERIHRRLAREHWDILEAIRSRDPDRAEAAMVHHIDGIIRDVREQVLVH